MNRYLPPKEVHKSWFQEAGTEVHAPFTVLPTRDKRLPEPVEVIPVPTAFVGCSECLVQKSGLVNRRSEEHHACGHMPDCAGVTFMPRTEANMTRYTLWMLTR